MKRLADRLFKENSPATASKATFAKTIVLGFLYLSCPILGTNRFLSIIRLRRDRSQVISEYVEGKQTRKQLAERYEVSVRTIGI